MGRYAIKEVGIPVGIAVFIAIFIEPIGTIVRPALFGGISHLYTGFVDNLYRGAANDSPARIPLFFLSNFLGLISGGVTVITMGTYNIWRRIRRLATEENGIPTEKVEPAKNSILPSPKLVGWLFAGTVLSGMLLVASIATITWSFQLQTNIQENLSKRVRILAAHITEQQRLDLDAQWAGVAGRADYDQLQDQIDKLAVATNVTLPDAYGK